MDASVLAINEEGRQALDLVVFAAKDTGGAEGKARAAVEAATATAKAEGFGAAIGFYCGEAPARVDERQLLTAEDRPATRMAGMGSKAVIRRRFLQDVQL